MGIYQPSSFPALLGMASLAVLGKLAGMRISVTLFARFPNSYKLSLGKFCSFGRLMAFDTRNGVVFSPEREA